MCKLNPARFTILAYAPRQKRRLAAIMFADIVGYTAMMQRNEAEGLATVHRFSEVMETLAKAYAGEILEFKGDGCLVVFDSAVQAVHAAKAIQAQLQESPAIPLRIGIHLGDIVFTKGNIYGDGVNLASRVESMGVPGSILVTERVIHDVKSHPEFEMTSLGRFQFKNVEKPMEVFAVANEGLAVPHPEEMKGKGEKVLTGKQRMKPLIRLAGVGFLAMIVGAILFWALGVRDVGQNQLLMEEIREEKVAVAIFENFTADDDLDALGYLASEWITSSLREIGIKTVAPEMMRQYKDYVGTFSNNPEGKPSFGEITKAQYLVSGSYFLQKDSIRLNTRLLDTRTGEEVQQFPVFWAKKSEKELLVEEARQRLMAFWAIEKNQHFPKVRPPKYKAYQKYLECPLYQLPCQMKVWELDSTFLLNHVSMMVSSVMVSNAERFLTSKNYVQKYWEKCTEYEKNIFRYANALSESNFDEAYRFSDLNYQADPENLWMIHQSTFRASANLNRPDITVERCGKLFSNYEAFRDHILSDLFFRYTEALNRMGKHQEVIDLEKSLPDNDWLEKAGSRAWFELYLSYLESEQPEKAIEWIDTLLTHRNSATFLSWAAYGWSAFYQNTVPNPFHDRIREGLRDGSYMSYEQAGIWNLRYLFFGGGPHMLRVYQGYLLADWQKAEKQFLALRETHPDLVKPGQELMANLIQETDFRLWVEAMLGNIYARQGKPQKALQQLDTLEGMRTQYSTFHNLTTSGAISYFQARIHALLGNKDEAVSLLKRSRNEGKGIYMWSFTMDWELASLRGYEPYEELIRPKGPKAP